MRSNPGRPTTKAVSIALVCGAIFLHARAARAVDPFEIQVYDGTANAPGVPGLELHVNSTLQGKDSAEAPELPPRHQTHFTLEPSLGVRPWWELGGYFQTALLGDGSFRYAGVKLRSKFVTEPGFHPNLRLGLNLEISRVPSAFERDRWGGELRPIVAWESQRWLLVANPIVELSFAGSSSSPSFAPAVMAKLKCFDRLAFGLEYYADLGPITRHTPFTEQEHYLFEALDLIGVRDFELNLGLGEGLTQSSNELIAKAILGYSWERARLWGR